MEEERIKEFFSDRAKDYEQPTGQNALKIRGWQNQVPHSELTPYMEPSIMRLRGLCNNVKMG